jgi:serine/threonine protein kinase
MIGLKINNYEIQSLLGEGGMGSVYLAVHPFLGRRAAIKILRKDLASNEQAVIRFMNEAKAANAIRHPNIIDVIDVGVLDGDTVYLMMELLEGEALAARIAREHTMALADVLNMATQACSALAASHAQGIVHRDLKPDNLFIVPDPSAPGRERLKILDFGIAKLRREMSSGAAKTSTGTLMGTPAYMSPEQCRGVPSEIDHRTDIYALGVILYEMLTGAPPFVAEGWGDIVMSHLSVDPRPPREVNPEIPEAVEAVILTALAKKKLERFASMAEMGDALMAAGDESAAPAPRPRPKTESGRPRPGTENRQRTDLGTGTRKMPSVQTTLRSSSGQLESAAETEMVPPTKSGRTKIVLGAVAAAALAGAVLALVTLRGPTPSVDPAGGVVSAGVAGGASQPKPEVKQPVQPVKPVNDPGPAVADPTAASAAGKAPASAEKTEKARGEQPEAPAGGDKPTVEAAHDRGGRPAAGAADPGSNRKRPRPVTPSTRRPATPSAVEF